jgi:hypothetical protein
MVARVVGVLAVVVVGGLAGGQPALPLSADSGPPGIAVTAAQEVDGAACETYTVFFDGAPVGTPDDGSDGEGEVTFEVPDVDPDDYPVVAECTAGEAEKIVGRASFTVLAGVPTTSATTIKPTTTSVGGTTTTRDDLPTTTSTGTIDPPPTNIAECEAEAAEAEGRLVYEPERTMVVGRTYEVAAALSLEGLPPVTFDGSTTVVTLPDLRCTITAELTGSDFAITPKSSASQSFIDTRVLDWRWDVRPRHSGDDLSLTLRFQATVVEGGQSVPGRSTLHASVIDVDAEPRSFWSTLNSGVVGFLTHPAVAPAAAVIVAGLVTWLGRKAQRQIAARRSARAATAPPADGSPPAEPGGPPG